MKRSLSLVLSLFIVACSDSAHEAGGGNRQSDSELLRFAEANCFFWYFKKKGYNDRDIGGISGGIVEMGSYGPEDYRKIAFFVRDHKPPIITKNEIDIDLLKCFRLREDSEFIDFLKGIE